MSKIEVKFTVDTANVQEVKNFIDMMYGFLPEGYTPSEPVEQESPKEEAKSETKKPKPATKKETPKKESKPKKEKKAEETKEGPTPEEKEESQDIKVEDVRSVLAKKVGGHRDAIKAKLTELGANNVTSLDESKYSEFIDFLNSL